jgi:hypothetical protein
MNDDRSNSNAPNANPPPAEGGPSDQDLVDQLLKAEHEMRSELFFILRELPTLDADPGRKAEIEGVVRPFAEELFWEVHRQLLELGQGLAASEIRPSRVKLIAIGRMMEEQMENYRTMMIRPDIPEAQPDDTALEVLTQEAGWNALQAYERFFEAANKLGERLYRIEHPGALGLAAN